MPRTSLPCITAVKSLRGRRVLVRTSLNVPIKNDTVQNRFRIEHALPTINHLRNAGARVILITHVGRDPEITLEPLHRVLSEYVDVTYEPSLIGKHVEKVVTTLRDSEIVLLENLRSHKEEVANGSAFAKRLASYADIYVNDAFAASHRDHASIVGIPRHIPSYIGITFQNEYQELQKAMKPTQPSLFILGGAKFKTKQPLIEQYLETYGNVFVGGAIANDFFKAKGYEVGTSLVSDTDLIDNPLLTHSKILLPVDVIVRDHKRRLAVKPGGVTQSQKILDIGPQSIAMLSGYIQEAKSILWNGPLGYYEEGYTGGTNDCALLIAKSRAHSVVGGGDTVAAIEQLGIHDKFSFLSTAGGAMLSFLEHKTLPGIEAIKEHRHD